MTELGNILGFIVTLLGTIFLISTVLFALVWLIDHFRQQSPDNSEIREVLYVEREYFKMLGTLTYWCYEAAEELEMSAEERSELLEAVETIDDLIIEDKISFDIEV